MLQECENLNKRKTLFVGVISIPDCFELYEILPKFNEFMKSIVEIIILKTEFPNYYTLVLHFKSCSLISILKKSIH